MIEFANAAAAKTFVQIAQHHAVTRFRHREFG
jgi:hypothetical protein